jgi:S-adenosylmethionine:tRNA ribosyltransferase-isomerase
VRALETAARADGTLEPVEGWTHLVITPQPGVRAVDGLLTGWHEPGASHLHLLEAVAGPDVVARSYRAALDHDYRWHEFGDVHLILP